jgi:hypothetical protein
MRASRKAGAHVTFRATLELLARVDTLIPYYSSPFRRATRSDVVRALIIASLPGVERAAKTMKNVAMAAGTSVETAEPSPDLTDILEADTVKRGRAAVRPI